MPDETDTITYDCNIAFESDHKSLKELINRLLSMVDVTFTFCVADYNAFHEYAYTHSRRMTTEEFIMKVADLVPDVSVLGEYCYGQGRIKCQCNRCGRVWHPVAASLLDGKGCKLCANRQIARNRMVSTEEIKTRLSSVHPAISLVGEYQGYNNKNAFVCKICGHQWKSTMSHALRPQGNGCPHCSRGKRRTHEQFAAEMKVVNPSIQILGEFVNTRTKVCCKCLRCNYEFETIANQLLRGVGCRQCYDKRRAQNLIKR